ncbi:hypothetical protein F2P81_018773 [Scophthalmus maximus]|uniref:Coiled-coil domain-containing protein 146 n=1 Tax=Scophthalmus maximus TaxID=52904 RepID=A0A6A4SBJ3_SCOMX|nr:hypothetical protein F2P81_018773 [Scophthalmus maximus]
MTHCTGTRNSTDTPLTFVSVVFHRTSSTCLYQPPIVKSSPKLLAHPDQSLSVCKLEPDKSWHGNLSEAARNRFRLLLSDNFPVYGEDVCRVNGMPCLLSLGKISQTKVERLKASYRILHDTLQRTQDCELQRLGEAKTCRAELERLHAVLERAEEQSTSEEPESEVKELRQQLLQAYNELKAAENTEYRTQHQLTCLREEKQYLEKESEIQLKPPAEKARLISVPDQIVEKIKRKRSKREAALKKTDALNTEISEMEKQVEKVEVRNHSLRVKKEEAMQKLEALQARVEASQTECRQLLREQEVNREEEAELVGNRGLLEMKLQNVMCDRKHLYESHSVQLREKTRQMQALKRMEQAMTMATEQQEHMQSIYDDVQAQLDAVPSREASVQQRMELQKEVDALKVGLEKKQLHQLLQHELREKDLIIMDHNKLNTMLQRRISQYSKLCDIIMEEKKKYVKLKQIASQTITELTEQLKILANETEIQRTIVVNKDRSLTKARMKLSNSSKMRDRLRNGISKVAWKHRQISQQSDDDKLELVKLTQMINFQEQALLEMNKNHETAVQRRNFLGIQLLEHEEVLFNYHGKVNVQEAAISKGNVVLETMEKETRDLQSAIKEEKRQIDLKKKKELPLKRKLEGEISMLQIELSEARDKTLECLSQTVDYKEIKGSDPSTVELVKKIEQLNNLRTHTINTNRRLMAISAELSVKQAVALSQQQEIKEKELQMDRCQRRLEHGLPPCPEMEEEWRRMLRDKKRRQRDKEEKERLAEEEEWTQLSNGEYTTAETRPNAYIPQTDSLPLPKPYGAQAPFKPSQPGANMRHIRKPTLKPLEI